MLWNTPYQLQGTWFVPEMVFSAIHLIIECCIFASNNVNAKCFVVGLKGLPPHDQLRQRLSKKKEANCVWSAFGKRCKATWDSDYHPNQEHCSSLGRLTMAEGRERPRSMKKTPRKNVQRICVAEEKTMGKIDECWVAAMSSITGILGNSVAFFSCIRSLLVSQINIY